MHRRTPTALVAGLTLALAAGGVLLTAPSGTAAPRTSEATVTLDPVAAWTAAGRAVTLSWTGAYAASYEINQSATDRLDRTDGATTTVLAPATSVDLTPTADAACFRVRATDTSDQVGAWSDPTCTRVDHYAPQAQAVQYPVSFTPQKGTDLVDVGYRFDAADDASGLAAYETRIRRSSPSADRYREWSGVHQEATGQRTVTVHAGDRICFQGRAVDKADQRSDWLVEKCTSAPYDDKVARRTSPTETVPWSDAYSGAARKMLGDSSLSVYSGSAQNCLSVRALGVDDFRAGSLRVYRAGRYRGTLTVAHQSSSWANFVPDKGSVCGKGVIELRHRPGTPSVTVDSVSLVRAGDVGYEYRG